MKKSIRYQNFIKLAQKLQWAHIFCYETRLICEHGAALSELLFRGGGEHIAKNALSVNSQPQQSTARARLQWTCLAQAQAWARLAAR